MGQFVIVAYKPKPEKEAELLELLKTHVKVLQGEGLATQRKPYLMRAANGTIVEVFEWQSQEAIEQAHTNKVVLQMWGKFNEACDIETLANLEESEQMFSPFAPIDF
jgi:quinol monooxygenase YgiN